MEKTSQKNKAKKVTKKMVLERMMHPNQFMFYSHQLDTCMFDLVEDFALPNDACSIVDFMFMCSAKQLMLNPKHPETPHLNDVATLYVHLQKVIVESFAISRTRLS